MSVEAFLAKIEFRYAGAPWGTVYHLESPYDTRTAPVSQEDQDAIIAAFRQLYSSPAAAALMDAFANDPTKILRIGTAVDGVPGFQQDDQNNGSYIGINIDAIDTLRWISDSGSVVAAELALVLIHELKHLANGQDDPPYVSRTGPDAAGFDYKGPQVQLQNQVAIDLGVGHLVQASYEAALFADDARISVLGAESLTGGAQIDVAILGYAEGEVLDTSALSSESRDLLIGFGVNDDLAHTAQQAVDNDPVAASREADLFDVIQKVDIQTPASVKPDATSLGR